MLTTTEAAREAVALLLFNPHHGEGGRFATEEGGSSYQVKKLPATHERADRREVPWPVSDLDLASRVYRAADLRHGEKRSVPLVDLVATQRSVQPDIVKRYVKHGSTGAPVVIEHEHKYYVADGHHRLAAEWAKGAKAVEVTVYQADPEKVKKPEPYHGWLDDKSLVAEKRDLIALSLFSADDAAHQGLLVSLWLDAESAAQLAVPGGEAPEDLHITLCYCGNVDDVGDVGIAQALVAVSQVASRLPPITATVGKLDRFEATPQSDGQDVLIARVESRGLLEMRQWIADALAEVGVPPRGDFEFSPHVTLQYVDPGVEPDFYDPEPIELRFEALTVSIGDRRTEFWLGTDAESTARTKRLLQLHGSPGDPGYEEKHPNSKADASSESAKVSGRPTPIKAKSLGEAVELVLQGKVVELGSPAEVHTLLDRLATMATEAKALGEKAPVYDLCQVSVAGTNLFCGSKLRTDEYPDGVPRLQMPQLRGKPVTGSAADQMVRSPHNTVDGSAAFVAFLKTRGIDTTQSRIPAAHLRASQAQLEGSKVAAMMQNVAFDPSAEPIFASRDNYVVDGHHRWAATVGRDSENNVLGDITMEAIVIDAPISEVLQMAKAWAADFGIEPAGIGLSYRARLALLLYGDSCDSRLGWCLTHDQPHWTCLVLGENPYRDACGRYTTQENDGGPCDEAVSAAVESRAERIRSDSRTSSYEKEHAVRIAQAEVRVEQELRRGDTFSRHRTSEGWTKERTAIHERLIAEAVQGKPAGIAEPTIVLMGGLTAAGKSTAVASLDTSSYVVVNADDFKAKLPEYNGENASVLHEESAYLAEATLRLAKERRQNIIFDGTLKASGATDDGGALGKASEFKKAGYRVEVRFVDVTVETSVHRSLRRYVEEERGSGMGRYVPADYIRSGADAEWGTKSRATFERLKASSLLDGYLLIDNNGTSPRVLEREGMGS